MIKTFDSKKTVQSNANNRCKWTCRRKNYTTRRSPSNIPIKNVNGTKNKLLKYWKGSTRNTEEKRKGAKLFIRTEISTKVGSQAELIFNPRKELRIVISSRILRWAIKLMTFDFDKLYVKGNTILHVDTLARQEFFFKLRVRKPRKCRKQNTGWKRTFYS